MQITKLVLKERILNGGEKMKGGLGVRDGAAWRIFQIKNFALDSSGRGR